MCKKLLEHLFSILDETFSRRKVEMSKCEPSHLTPAFKVLSEKKEGLQHTGRLCRVKTIKLNLGILKRIQHH